MKENNFEEPLQENYLVKEAIECLNSFNLDFLIEQAKQKGHFSYEILVGVIDYLIEENSKKELVEYHHVVFTKKVLTKMIESSLDNWSAPELRRHYLRELDLKINNFAYNNFQTEMILEQKRKNFNKKKDFGNLSLEEFEIYMKEEK